MSTLFAQIVAGEVPSFKIYEDEHTYAFLDIRPVNPGHTLIVPKIEVDYFVDVPEPYYTAVFQTAKKISPAIEAASECSRIGAAIVGFEVPHFHYHLIPLVGITDLDFSRATEASEESLKRMHEKILSHLNVD